jgi:hypothetical protein
MGFKLKKPKPPSVKKAVQAVKKAVPRPAAKAATAVRKVVATAKKAAPKVARAAQRVAKSVKPSVKKATKAIKTPAKKGASAVKNISNAAKKAGRGVSKSISKTSQKTKTAAKAIKAKGKHLKSTVKKAAGKAKKAFAKSAKKARKAAKSAKKKLNKSLGKAKKAKVTFPKNVKGPKATCPLLAGKGATPASVKLKAPKLKIPKPNANVVGGIIGGVVAGPIGVIVGAAGGKATVDLAANLGRSAIRRVINVGNEGLKIVKDVGTGLGAAANLAREGKTDQAVGKVLETAAKAYVQAVSLPVMEGISTVRDAGWAVAGAVAGRNLTEEEKAFARNIFGDKIDLSSVRIFKPIPGARASVAGNSILLGEDPLKIPVTFAHELTHIYQDQNPRELGSRGATREMICSYCSWSHISVKDFKAPEKADRRTNADPEESSDKSPKHQAESQYKGRLNSDSNWSDLGAEQQAMVVQNWYSRQNGYVPNSDFNASDADYARVLKQAGLFPNDPIVQAAPSSKFSGNAW